MESLLQLLVFSISGDIGFDLEGSKETAFYQKETDKKSREWQRG